MKNILVVSYPRSGTHFLINAIRLNFEYYKKGWSDIDSSQREVNCWIDKILNNTYPVIFKSHHQSYSFKKFKEITNKTHIFYVIRDGRDVMTSNYHSWCANYPREPAYPLMNMSNFLLSDPITFEANKYDYIKENTFIGSWREHVNSWIKAINISTKKPRLHGDINVGPRKGIIGDHRNIFDLNIHCIFYEDLWLRFDEVINKISNIIKQSPIDINAIKKPRLHGDINVGPRKGIIGDHRNIFDPVSYLLFDRYASGIVADVNGIYNVDGVGNFEYRTLL